MNVLIVRLSAMGDIVHALPLAVNLKRAGCNVAWIVEAASAELLAGNPNVDAIIPVATGRWRRSPLSRATRRELDSVRAELCAFAPDVVLDAQGNQKSWWVCRLTPAPRIALDDRSVRRDRTRHLSALRVVPPDSAAHVTDRTLALLGPLRVAVTERKPDLRYLLPRPGTQAHEFLRTVPHPFALYHPGAAWANKCWGEERFAQLAHAVEQGSGIHPVVSWGPGDEPRAGRLAELLGCPKIPPLGLAGLAQIISEARFFAAGDTGPLHMADALDVPTAAFFGPTDPWRNGPFRRDGLMFYRALACGPCNGRFETVKRCLSEIEPGPAAAALVERFVRA